MGVSQVIGPLKPTESFTQEDFNLLEKFTLATTSGKIEKKIKTYRIEDDKFVYYLIFIFTPRNFYINLFIHRIIISYTAYLETLFAG